MPLTAEFFRVAERLYEPGMGTEAVGPLLYALARMTRPRTAMEVGLGYTTPFLAQGLADARAEFEADRARLQAAQGETAEELDKRRLQTLIPGWLQQDYRPKLHAIDDVSIEHTTAAAAFEAIRELGLEDLVEPHQGDFRGYGARLQEAGAVPLDLVWFDCGGPKEYVAFFREYWPLLNPNHGLAILHFTYWALPVNQSGQHAMLPSPLVNELKRQQAAAGEGASYEVLSLLEPHKSRQGSVTLIRRLGQQSRQRPGRFEAEMGRISGQTWEPLDVLS